MAKYRAIPQGFMTVGEVAKKMGVTVRTLQYYDKEGFFPDIERKQLFETQKEAVITEMKHLEKNLAMLEFKCWYYAKAIADGNENGINAMLPDKLPKEIQKLYNTTHE